MRVAHLFAGVGGGLYADLILGHTPVVAVEISPYCCQVLRERKADGTFPDLRIIEADVRTVDFATELAGCDAICAGFPCQDISCAGKGGGITGERSGLYREVIRAVDDIRPAWVFLENSPNIRTHGRHVVIGDLVARGYAWRDGRLGAHNVGAPHKRDRWWCLATNTHGSRELQQEGCEQTQRGRSGDSVGKDATDAAGVGCDQTKAQPGEYRRRGRGEVDQPAADADLQRLEVAERGKAGGQQQTPAGGGRNVGWWGIEPGVVRVVHGFPNRGDRIKSLGNSQAPLCAAVAWKALGGP